MIPDDPLDSLSAGQRVRALYEDALSAREPMNRSMREERAFCWDLEQYDRDSGNTRNRTRVQPRDQSPFRLARFKASFMLKSPPYFKARPVDQLADPKSAYYTKWALEFELTNPKNRMDRVIRDAVWSGLTSRMGGACADWNPDSGVYGDLEYRFVIPDNLMWAQPFTDPHDPQCPWLLEVVPDMPYEQLKRMTGWKDVDKVQPDDGKPRSDTRPTTTTEIGGMLSTSGSGHPQIERMKTNRTVTLVKLWERFSDEKRVRVTNRRTLPEDQQYMAVRGGPRDGERVNVAYPDGLPKMDVLQDGTVIHRVDTEQTEETSLAYPNGKLTICAVYSGDGVILYEGPWPQPMRTFPYLVWQPYANPFRQIGPSDVDLNWTMTLVKNGVVRRWYEQLYEARGIILLPDQGLEDAYGEPFMYTDANGVQAFYKTLSSANGVRMVSGPEPSPQLERFYHIADNALRGNEGSGDISSLGDAQQLKGVAVGAIERSVATGNQSVDDHVASWEIEFGLWLGVISDIQRARWTEPRLVRYLGEDGRDAYKRMRGSDIPAADITITARPTLDQFNAETVKGLSEFADLAQKNPGIAAVFGRHMDVDADDMRMILEAAQKAQAPPEAPPSSDAQMITAIAGLFKVDPTGQVAGAVLQVLGKAGLNGQPANGPPNGTPGAMMSSAA